MQSVELCSDMIDVVLDVSGIYGMGGTTPAKNASKQGDVPSLEDGKEDYGDEVLFGGDHHHGDDVGMNELGAAAAILEDVNALDMSGMNNETATGEDDKLLDKLVGESPPSIEDEDEEDANDADAAGSAYDSESSSTIHLSNGMVLYLKEVDTMLALVCLTRAENFRKKSSINYNIGCLKKALRALPQSTQGGASSATSAGG